MSFTNIEKLENLNFFLSHVLRVYLLLLSDGRSQSGTKYFIDEANWPGDFAIQPLDRRALLWRHVDMGHLFVYLAGYRTLAHSGLVYPDIAKRYTGQVTAGIQEKSNLEAKGYWRCPESNRGWHGHNVTSYH